MIPEANVLNPIACKPFGSLRLPQVFLQYLSSSQRLLEFDIYLFSSPKLAVP